MTWLRRMFPARGTPSGWVCVGQDGSSEETGVFLESRDAFRDVSRNHAIVALNPFTVAIQGGDAAANALIIRETRASGKTLGRVELKFTRSLNVPGGTAGLFVIQGNANYCVPAARREAVYLRERWKAAYDRNPRNLKMRPSDLFAMWALHCLPRPVMAVGYGSAARGNIFPMDLVGALGERCFVLGMHATSPALPAIERLKRLTVREVPFEFSAAMYGLAKNHRADFLVTGESEAAIKAAALSVRELELVENIDLGSHRLLITEVRDFERRARGLRMCHIHAFYHEYLVSRENAMPVFRK